MQANVQTNHLIQLALEASEHMCILVLGHEWPTQMYHDTIWSHETLKLDAMATFPVIAKCALVLEWVHNFSDHSINECEYIVDAMTMLITMHYHLSIAP